MPELPNKKHENYARHRASGMLAAKASTAAGYAPGSAITTELERDAEITARVQELIDDKAEKREQQRITAMAAAEVAGQVTGLSHGVVLNLLHQNAINAAADGDYKESNAALKLIGEQLGMWGKGGSGGDGSVQPGDITPEAIAEAAAKRLGHQAVVVDALGVFAAPPGELEVVDRGEVAKLVGASSPARRMLRPEANGSEADVALTAAAEIEDIP